MGTLLQDVHFPVLQISASDGSICVHQNIGDALKANFKSVEKDLRILKVIWCDMNCHKYLLSGPAYAGPEPSASGLLYLRIFNPMVPFRYENVLSLGEFKFCEIHTIILDDIDRNKDMWIERFASLKSLKEKLMGAGSMEDLHKVIASSYM